MGFSTLVAVFLWFIATLSQRYNTTIKLPIRVQGVPNNIELTELRTPSIELELEGKGSDLFVAVMQMAHDTVDLDFQEVVSDPDLLDNRRFQNELTHFLSDKFTLIQVLTERIQLAYENKISKKVPLVYDAIADLPDGYLLSADALLLDDSVSIFGPETAIDSINEWPTKEGITISLDGPDTLLIPLKIPPGGLTITPHHARVFLSPKQYTEARLRIPVTISQVPENVKVRLSHEEVMIACLVPLSNYSTIVQSLSATTIKVPFENLDGEVPTLIPSLNLPDSIRQVYQEPLSISFVIVEQAP